MEKKESKIKHCGICETDATCLCFDCYNYFCESCFKFVHEKGKGKSNHIKEKIDPYLPFNFRCPEHKRRLLDLFFIEEKEELDKFNLFVFSLLLKILTKLDFQGLIFLYTLLC